MQDVVIIQKCRPCCIKRKTDYQKCTAVYIDIGKCNIDLAVLKTIYLFIYSYQRE